MKRNMIEKNDPRKISALWVEGSQQRNNSDSNFERTVQQLRHSWITHVSRSSLDS